MAAGRRQRTARRPPTRTNFEKDVEQVLEQVARRPVTVEPTEPRNVFGRAFELAGKHAMTAYDARYLELARRRQIALATLDRKRRDACEAVGVVLLP